MRDVKLAPPYYEAIMSLKRVEGFSLSEAVEDCVKTKDNWMELEEHLPPGSLKDVGRFVANLNRYWELASQSITILKRENQDLQRSLKIYEDIIDQEKPGRVAMIKRARGLYKQKPIDRREKIKQKLISHGKIRGRRSPLT